MKKKVLIMTSFYEPSYKGGGPIQSIKNLVDNLSQRYDFYIITSDRDLGDTHPFTNIKIDEWVQVGNAKVLYTNPSNITLKKIKQLINTVDCEIIYLNSFFSYRFSIIPILFRKLYRINKPVVIAPRGEFSSGALALKSIKKKLFINVAKAMGLYKNVTWHATAQLEKQDIELVFGGPEKIIIANNLTKNYENFGYLRKPEKKCGDLKLVFISRIHPKKNLKKAIELLKNIDGNVEFNIYGPIEDTSYWSSCQEAMKCLSPNIKVSYKGAVNHNQIINIFNDHHAFLFPTLGENFGHVISEAMIGGCPVIISDQTPWRNLEDSRVGWDISLTDEDKFIEVIQQLVYMEDNLYKIISKNAYKYGKKMSNNKIDIEQSSSLFM